MQIDFYIAPAHRSLGEIGVLFGATGDRREAALISVPGIAAMSVIARIVLAKALSA